MAQNQIYCPSCGNTCSKDINYCPVCGTKLIKLSPPPFPANIAKEPRSREEQIPPSIPAIHVKAPQSDFITLSCPNCGGKLQITPDIERFACQYCGYEHIVRRNGGVVSLEPVVKIFKNINSNIDQLG